MWRHSINGGINDDGENGGVSGESEEASKYLKERKPAAKKSWQLAYQWQSAAKAS
jgi:hypothetical protein